MLVYLDGTSNIFNEKSLPIHNIIAISSGNAFSLVLTSDGYLFAVGSNRFGQLGNGQIENEGTIDLSNAVKTMSDIVVN